MTPFQYIVKKNKWFTPTDRVLIAVSGGVDSIVLLDMMCRLPSDLRPIIGVAHVNHQLREVSDVEEQFVQELATAYDVPCYCYRWAEGADLQTGIEYEAREIRYQFFEQVMMDQQFNVLLTAHHQDDQAETVLMKLIRGGLLEEKTGIPRQRTFGPGKIIRPLLDYTKVELCQYAAEHKLTYKEDASNASDQFLRNRLRHDVLPQLQAENPQAVAHLSEFAQELAELVEAYQPHLQKLLVKVIELDEESLTVDIPLLLSHSRAVQKLLLKEGLKKVFQQEGQFNKQYIEETLDWLQTSAGNSRLDWQEVGNVFVPIMCYGFNVKINLLSLSQQMKWLFQRSINGTSLVRLKHLASLTVELISQNCQNMCSCCRYRKQPLNYHFACDTGNRVTV